MIGIGGLSHIQEYVGIPYVVGGRSVNGVDCWGLCCMLYFSELGVQLPDWVIDDEIDFELEGYSTLEEPSDFCLVRSERAGGQPDHYGVYIAGSVLSAARPMSTLVSLSQYVSRHPDTKFIVPVVATDG